MPNVDHDAIGPPDPQRSHDRRVMEAIDKGGKLPDRPAPEPGSMAARIEAADANMQPVRERTGTGLSAERRTPRRW